VASGDDGRLVGASTALVGGVVAGSFFGYRGWRNRRDL
jgi:hypothetical protein